MNRRDLVIAIFFTIFGLGFTARQYPQLRALQILLPFTCGIAAGIALGSALWLKRVIS